MPGRETASTRISVRSEQACPNAVAVFLDAAQPELFLCAAPHLACISVRNKPPPPQPHLITRWRYSQARPVLLLCAAPHLACISVMRRKQEASPPTPASAATTTMCSWVEPAR